MERDGGKHDMNDAEITQIQSLWDNAKAELQRLRARCSTAEKTTAQYRSALEAEKSDRITTEQTLRTCELTLETEREQRDRMSHELEEVRRRLNSAEALLQQERSTRSVSAGDLERLRLKQQHSEHSLGLERRRSTELEAQLRDSLGRVESLHDQLQKSRSTHSKIVRVWLFPSAASTPSSKRTVSSELCSTMVLLRISSASSAKWRVSGRA